LARLNWVRQRGGEEAVRKVLARVPEWIREVLAGQILHVTFYPLEVNLRPDEAIADVLSPNDRERVFLQIGAASADINLAGPHKAYVHAGDPQALLSRAPVIYQAYYNTGHRSYERTSDTSAVLRTFDADLTTPADCLTVVGWHVRAIEICGGKNAKVVETICRHRGGERCEYVCTWS
jgi:uncharacterized protein (TIGR02265 family)